MAFSQRPDTACCQVTGATGAIVAGSNFKITSSVRTGAGAYTITSDRSFTVPVVDIQILGGAAQSGAQVAPQAGGLVFLVTTFVAAAATDLNFMFSIEEAIL